MEEITRTEKILAMILLQTMNDASQADKAFTLSNAGFSNSEIAKLLCAKTAVITQQIYEQRKTKKKTIRQKGK